MASHSLRRLLVAVACFTIWASVSGRDGWTNPAPSSPASGECVVRMAGIGGNFGNRCADQIFSSGDLPGSIDRIDHLEFNSLSPQDLRDRYDVLLFTWATRSELNADWNNRLLPYLQLGGGIIWEDPTNIPDLTPFVHRGGGSSWPLRISASVPGLTDGIADSWVNNHILFGNWDPRLSPFIQSTRLPLGTSGLYGEIDGGRIVLTGPDQDFHGRRGVPGHDGNQYNLLLNEVKWVAKCGERDLEPPVVDLAAEPCVNTPSATVNVHVEDESGTTLTTNPPTPSISLPPGVHDLTLTVPLDNEGENEITVQVDDDCGNSAGAFIVVIRDTIPPAVSFITPGDGEVFADPTLGVSVQVVDDTQTTADVAGASATFPEGGGVLSTLFTGVEGPNPLTATATDCAGNTTTASVTPIIDLTAPKVNIDSPADGACFGPGEENVPVMATVNDLTATVVSSDPPGVSGSPPAGGGSVPGTVTLAEGLNCITVRAVDQAGREGCDQVCVNLDTTPPVAAWLEPSTGECLRGTVTLRASAVDILPGTGIANVEATVQTEILSMSLSGGAYEAELDTLLLADGAHTVTLTATDGKGNATTATLDIVVDNTPPTVNILSPADGSVVCGSIGVQTFASDDTCGIDRVELYAAGGLIDVIPNGTFPVTTSVETENYAEGAFALRAVAVDRAGNSASTDIVVTIDNLPPATSIVSPINGQVVSGTILIQGDVLDAFLATVEFFADGNSLGVLTAPPFEVSLDTLTLLDGSLNLSLVATDTCGNQSTAAVSVTVDNIDCKITPQSLNLGSKGKENSVTAHLEGLNVDILIPTEANSIRLALPDGSEVPSTQGFSGDDASSDDDGDGIPELPVKFDRQLLEDAVEAGIGNGSIDPSALLPVRVIAGDGKEICSDNLKIIESKKK